jgi:hypothetical protein
LTWLVSGVRILENLFNRSGEQHGDATGVVQGVPMARGWTGARPDQIIAVCWLYL